MRMTVFVAFVAAFLLWPTEYGRAQSDDLQGGIFFTPNAARRVTFTRSGALLASFEVPEGTWLSAAYDDQEPTSIEAGRWEFHGDVVLRALPLSESSPPPGGGRRMEAIMEEARLVLAVQDVDVVIENVSP